MFLINNFQVFLIIYSVILLDTLFGVTEALYNKKFNFNFLPEFIYTMIRDTIFLAFGNAVQHFADITGYKVDWGIFVIGLVLLGVECHSIVDSLIKLSKPKSIPTNQ